MRRKLYLLFFIIASVTAFTVYRHYFWHPHLPPPRDYAHSNVVRKNELTKIKVDYEDTVILNNTNSVSAENKFSGEFSCKLSDSIEYGSCLNMPVKSITDFSKVKKIEIQSQIFSAENGEGKWVLEIDDANGKIIYWQGKPFTASEMWKKFTFKFTVDASTLNAATFKVYPWNVSKKKIFLDDVLITFLSSDEESEKIKIKSYFYCDYETDNPDYDYALSDKKSHSGKRSVMLGGKIIYSPQICSINNEVTDDTLKLVSSSVWINAGEDDADFSFTIAIVDESGKQIFWNEKNTHGLHLKKDKWYKLNAGFNFTPVDYHKFHASDNICIYVWNKTSMTLFLDDFEIVYGQEKDRPGSNSNVNLQQLNGQPYSYVRNKPPFPELFLNFYDASIKNASLISGNKKGELNPDDNFISGNFTGDKRDEIVCIKNNLVELFTYDEKIKSFNYNEFPESGNNIEATSKLLKGDLDGDGTDEMILCNDKTGIVNAFKLNPFKFLSSFIVNPVLKDEDVFISCGNYENDRYADILIAGIKSGNFNIVTLKSDKLELKTIGKSDPSFFNKNSKSIDGKFFPKSKLNNVIITSAGHDFDNCNILSYNGDQKKFIVKKISDNSFLSSILTNDDLLLKGNFDDDAEDEILVLRRKDRFELYLVDADEKGFYINAKVDFTGYQGNQNPKYYEFPAFIAGNFFNTDETSIMCIVKNCDDSDFSGLHCKTYSNLPYLPNAIQFYSFHK